MVLCGVVEFIDGCNWPKVVAQMNNKLVFLVGRCFVIDAVPLD